MVSNKLKYKRMAGKIVGMFLGAISPKALLTWVGGVLFGLLLGHYSLSRTVTQGNWTASG